MQLDKLISIAKGIEMVCRPLAEVVIHNLDTKTIEYITGTLSLRKKGDESLLDVQNSFKDIQNVVYEKLLFNGRIVKSISVYIDMHWLMCINIDQTLFQEMHALCEQIINKSTDRKPPESLFNFDWQMQIDKAIAEYIKNNALQFSLLTLKDKKKIVMHLLELGVFNQKKAVTYIAKVLQISRPTIFNYQRAWKNESTSV